MTEKTESFTWLAKVYRRLRGGQQPQSLKKVFRNIYLNNSWGDAESVSGRDSTLARTRAIRRDLPALLVTRNIKSLVDAACGDFNWLQYVDITELDYTGVDIVPELIEKTRRSYAKPGKTFLVADITCDALPQADAILCRDCFTHLPFDQIKKAVENFKRSNSTWLLATTHAGVEKNKDAEAGGRRNLNLQLEPFSFPQPIELLAEDANLGKLLGVWKIEEL